MSGVEKMYVLRACVGYVSKEIDYFHIEEITVEMNNVFRVR